MEMPMGPISGVNGAEFGFVFWEVVCLQRGLGSFCQKSCCGGGLCEGSGLRGSTGTQRFPIVARARAGREAERRFVPWHQ